MTYRRDREPPDGRVPPEPRDGSEHLVEGTLKFRSFADAERTILYLEGLRREYAGKGDRAGVSRCRAAGLRIRRRAEMISRNARVRPCVRAHKAEIACWFQIWLETPELAEAWLSMRKQTPEYLQLEEAERDGTTRN
jgi:hypothetical protein